MGQMEVREQERRQGSCILRGKKSASESEDKRRRRKQRNIREMFLGLRLPPLAHFLP